MAITTKIQCEIPGCGFEEPATNERKGWSQLVTEQGARDVCPRDTNEILAGARSGKEAR